MAQTEDDSIDVDSLKVGSCFTETRHITEADIAAFAALVGDTGRHHMAGQAERVMAHGLLTASLATKVGGRLHYIARRMEWEFLKPVWAGDTIEAQVTVVSLGEHRVGVAVEFELVIVNQDGEPVLRGGSTGVIRR
ncbi:enoyl-CoA hydratase [Streptomyces sp. NBRC 14336]|uniref:MaoC/PaaZ C-terminal domain-containing protein n=1 Tax=Streptomyces sp. NBRC 14336 TaxID=3030992 RepID=UPI0024A320EB|nr:MaoC/PaaZ C-terminal domain-containing protein [Streptomyces sp. NBRC 14336]GLW46820.1 enoyl-CoA hydratase [Streptomyces sp. NBRC 14336]